MSGTTGRAPVSIRRARPEESAQVSELALRSKAHWGYSPEFMAACREELLVTEAYVRENPTWVAERDGVLLGFYGLERQNQDRVELGFLFVEPGEIGCGYGRDLMSHAVSEARRLGYQRMRIESDPHAERFYRAAGGRLVGSAASASIAGRSLPVLEIDL